MSDTAQRTVLRVSGSHAEVGQQIGRACRAEIRRATAISDHQLPDGLTLADQLNRATPYRRSTERHLPWLVEELDAAASAAEVDPLLLFAVSIEEIWPARDTTAITPISAVHGCTDVIATGPATVDGRTLIGHNNDLPAHVQADIRAVEWRVDDSPAVFSLGIGPWLSVSWNEAGLGVTGNELAPNDDTIGIPRLLLMTAASRCDSVSQAESVVTDGHRASSYNWVLTDRTGAVSVEGSATADVVIRPDASGWLHHENHYTHPSMLRFERNATHADRSVARGRRVAELVAHMPPGSGSASHLMRILSDHNNAPNSICRHAARPDDMQTVFWTAVDTQEADLTYGFGPPCHSERVHFRF